MDQSNTRYLRVEGDLVTAIRETVERQMPLKDFVDSIRAGAALITPMLPNDCVLYASRTTDDAETSVFIVEWMAGDLLFNFRESMPTLRAGETQESLEARAGNREKKYKISLPYIYWAHVFTCQALKGVVPFATRAPLRTYGHTTQIFRVPLPNIFPAGNMCLGEDLKLATNAPMIRRVNETMKYIKHDSWWNSDLAISLTDLGVNTYEEWEKRTIERNESFELSAASPDSIPTPLWCDLRLSPYKAAMGGTSSAYFGQFLSELLGTEREEYEIPATNIYPVIVRG